MNKSYSRDSKAGKTDRSFVSMDSTALRSNLQEYYKASKDKLLKLKSEIDELDQENEKQRLENVMQTEKIQELSSTSDQISKENKDLRSKILEENRKKASLISQNRDLTKEIEEIDKDIESTRINNLYKIKVLQSDIEHMTSIKDVNIKSIKAKIEQEQLNEEKLTDTLKEFKKEISKYKALIDELHEQDNERNKLIVQETYEMTKFLSEL